MAYLLPFSNPMIADLKFTKRRLSIAVAEPELSKFERVKYNIEKTGNIVYHIERASKIINIVKVREIDISFIDYDNMDYSVEDLMKETLEIQKDILTIFFAERFTKEMMLQILIAGAYAFIEFPFDEDIFQKLLLTMCEKKQFI